MSDSITARPLRPLVLFALVAVSSGLHASRAGLTRRDISQAIAVGAAVSVLPPPSWAGPSGDLKTDRVLAMRKYSGRVLAGRDYWSKDLPRQISSGEWSTIRVAVNVGIDPTDKKGMRKKYGTILGMVSPMELWASSFSRSAQRSPQSAEMLAAVEDLKAAVELLNTASAASVKDGGLFGFFGATKEPSPAEREKNARQALAQGTKAINAYLTVLNDFLSVMDEAAIPLV